MAERTERIRQLTEIARSGKLISEPALDVMRLLREYGEPQLWHEVSHYFVFHGTLAINSVLTAANLPDLEFLFISGEARDFTSLELGHSNKVFSQDDAVERLCNGLKGLGQLKKLYLSSTGLTDHGLSRICHTIQQSCRRLTYLICQFNEVTDRVQDVVRQTLGDVSGLRINLTWCRLSEDVKQRLKDEFGPRIHVFERRHRQRLTRQRRK